MLSLLLVRFENVGLGFDLTNTRSLLDHVCILNVHVPLFSC